MTHGPLPFRPQQLSTRSSPAPLLPELWTFRRRNTLGVGHAMPRLRERLNIRLGTALADVMPVFRHSAIPPALSNEVKPADIVWSVTERQAMRCAWNRRWSTDRVGSLTPLPPKGPTSLHCRPGVPSLLLTLWCVAPKTTKDVLGGFDIG